MCLSYPHALQKGRKIEPKVIVPFRQKSGQAPRRIEIERKTRLYASQNVEELLRKEGIDYAKYSVETDHESGKPCYLPLEIFDDTEYESRSPAEWIQLGTDDAGVTCVDSKALRVEADGSGRYRPCEVIGYDATEQKFTVVWKDREGAGAAAGGKESKDGSSFDRARLFRIHICFQAENPFVYAKRVANAHLLRREMEAHIRYSLYVDQMPTDEISQLDTEQVNRILLLAVNTKKLKANALDATSLLNEVNIDYARTMNKIIFDVNLKDPSNASLRTQLRLAAPGAVAEGEEIKECPYLGVVQVPFHDFPKHFSDFCFHSFYTKTEAINALVKVNTECLRLGKMSVFNTSISKSVSLTDFEAFQALSMKTLNEFIKQKWTIALNNCIMNSLRDVSKGWLNLHEKNRCAFTALRNCALVSALDPDCRFAVAANAARCTRSRS